MEEPVMCSDLQSPAELQGFFVGCGENQSPAILKRILSLKLQNFAVK